MFKKLREELYGYYLHGDAERCRAFAERCFRILDGRVTEGMTVTEEKLLQYEVISENFQPKIFPSTPFYYEMGVVTSLCDGARRAKGHDFVQANGWVFEKNRHRFIDQDKELFERRAAHSREKLYNICGNYNDFSQHFNFNLTPFLKIGAVGVYKRAERELEGAVTDSEREFLSSVMTGMLTLKRIAERFAAKAEEMLSTETDAEAKKNLKVIKNTATRVPWEAPRSFYEALEVLVFMRCAFGALEGVGANTFGRVDVDLYPFYKADIESGVLTPEEAYRLVCEFLLLSDCHYDHDMLMEGYADHELENTYTLGGCDEDGEPIYNEVTEMFLRATYEERIIFPKIKCRFSSRSPREYLEAICRPIINGVSTVLLVNDESLIPALVRGGRPLAEARDYRVTGCWSIATNQEKYDHGDYLNLLKPFEYSVHRLYDKMEEVGIEFLTLDGSEIFEEVYSRTLENCERLLDEKLKIKRRGGGIWYKVDRMPIFSSTLEGCIESRRDFTEYGAKYYDEFQLLFGLPNIVDSLLAIKTLVFDEGRYTLDELLTAVRENWVGHEDMREAAIACHGWGDGSLESTSLAARFNGDLYRIASEKTAPRGGRVHIGHLTYTEIRWWGEATLATPDGRRSGEVFSQGLTPSRLKKIPCVNDVINSLSALDGSMMAASSVVNIILPKGIPLDRCVAFLRASAKTALGSLQLNCTSREELLDAKAHPEKYPDLIVRVTGFSARFTSLSPKWQDEVISRNFYE